MKYEIIIRNFEGYNIQQRTNDWFLNATELLEIYNQSNGIQKRFKDFWENQSTQQIYKNICIKLGVSRLHEAIRGKGGATWMHEELLIVLNNWLQKIPNQSITRDEITFCSFIEESFKGILSFERQKKFGTYYVDLYCEELKLCIEFDEEFHSKQITLDEKRQKQIETEFEVLFLRHKIKEDFSVMINKIIRMKESYNIVQSIKNNKIPKKGFL